MQKLKLFLLASLLLSVRLAWAQQNVGVGTNTPDPSAALDVVSNSQGVLVPRLTAAQRSAVAAPATGLLVFDVDSAAFFFYDGAAWARVGRDATPRYWQKTGSTLHYDGGRTFIGRNYPITLEELFGISDSTSSYGGMYVETRDASGNGRPFYGYAVNGQARAWTTFDAASSAWRLYNSVPGSLFPIGDFRLSVLGDGKTGIGTTTPQARLHVNTTGPESLFRIDHNGSIKVITDNQGQFGIGTNFPTDRLHVNADADEDAMRVQVGGATKLRVHNNGSVSVGTANPGDQDNSLYVWGNTGLGTTAPDARLHVNAGGGDVMRVTNGSATYLEVENNGEVGIGTSNPGARLQIDASTGQDAFRARINGATKLMIHDNGSVSVGGTSQGPENGMYVRDAVSIGSPDPAGAKLFVDASTGEDAFRARINGSTKLMVHDNGSVSVGTASSGSTNGLRVSGDASFGLVSPPTGYRVAVDGKMLCEEVRVELSQNWPDYVFADDYELMPLEAVAAHLKEKRHLPGIPAAAEVKSEGLAVGEMQRRMMEKIEELTLYLIEQQERIAALEAELNDR